MSESDKETSTYHNGNTHLESFAPPVDGNRRRTSVIGQPAYTEKGPLINHEIPQADVVQEEPDLAWSRIRRYFREPLAEFFGVFILILFGDGVVAQVVLSGGRNGDYQSISWGWGCWAPCAPPASSTPTTNPRSTRTVPGSGSNTSTAGIFCTYPAPFMTKTGMFFSEFIASAILMFCIYALKDDGNLGAGHLTPLAPFFVIFGIGACFGWETGYAINLARDFGPRLMSYFLGYGHEVWSAGGYYFWVPMVAPFFGCAFGGWLYDMFLFTGVSPINTPYVGLQRLVRPRRSVWSNTYQDRHSGVV
ncbi:hypothetical protein EPUS_04296 [Endocarpon pusillum Z07020]|uniref:Uncharacterized protein n=1 Tax=Endocarpon pusillum (strain Z07020 / HMAS-L-300199) TaxID=1263415 RepID=U1I2M5_ENDPU|nr:uncharacterized protein EPUS_04296 [Endocarpon pusillum Z07020]ERF76219.1 hypothetical protein EPUS_04296 [Endocarpon pusillum Z07020]